MKTRLLTLSAALLITVPHLAGCGPSITNVIPRGATLPRTVAFLPSEPTGEIPRERIDLVRTAIGNELRNQGFLVIDQAITNSLCSTATCPERAKLVERYKVDGFATLTLTSFSRNNFLAGYYNQLNGTLSLLDSHGVVIATVEHNENERGGLLLSSGQVLQGVLSQVQHSSDTVFSGLADRFAKRIVETAIESIGRPTDSTITSPSQISIADTEVKITSESTYVICATGSPHVSAALLKDTSRATLREISPGKYCGAFSALVGASQPVTIELRSAFGDAARQEVTLPIAPPCNLEQRAVLTPAAAGYSELSLVCTKVGSDTSAAMRGCFGSLQSCATERLLVFSSSSPDSQYRKIFEGNKASARIPATEKSIEVVAVGKGGVSSLPVKLDTK
jgi:hypothetical protein